MEIHSVRMNIGEPESAKYTWEVVPENGTTTDMGIIEGDSATVFWDGPPGIYSLQVSAIDGKGCLSDTISKQIEIIESGGLIINAGTDTTISSGNPYVLHATVEEQDGVSYTYLWEPSENLDDATSASPTFTPGNTTTFKLTVTSSLGTSASDTVKVTVSEIIANAGEDLYMHINSTALLDGSASVGADLQYKWTTVSGKIDSGENTASPIISGFGMYYLEIKDKYNYVSTDSVEVLLLAHAPIANDDYDTTAYETKVEIAVLNNDTDVENNIDSMTLAITAFPLYGSAYINFDDFTIHYTPDDGFTGSDNFEYQICNIYEKCDEAKVYVWVSEHDFWVPDAFSPNGDGINDYFEIPGIEYYEGNMITIINRWGNKVYEAKNYGISTSPKFWDGKSNTGFKLGNEELPAGTYFYVLDFGNGEKRIAGSVYLDR